MEIKRRYQSLFNEIDFSTCAANNSCLNLCKKVCFESQHYEGNIGNLFHNLDHELSSALRSEFNLSKPKQQFHVARLILDPPRIIRAILDYKIENPDDSDIEGFLGQSLDLGLDIYQRKRESLIKLNDLKQQITGLKGKDFLMRKVAQNTDQWTWKSGNPQYSQGTAEYLKSIMRNLKDVLFVALGHGGVAAGMDVFLRYCDMTNSNNSKFYACRFSRAKWEDKSPRLTSKDISYLQEQGIDRQVVIFDEDVASPDDGTLIRAKDFFIDQIFPGQYVFAVANRCLN